MTRRRDKAQQPVGTRRAAREFAFRALFEAQGADLPLSTVFTRAEGAMREGDAARDLALELLALSEGYAARVLTGSLTAEEAVAALERRLAIESP